MANRQINKQTDKQTKGEPIGSLGLQTGTNKSEDQKYIIILVYITNRKHEIKFI